MSPPIRNTGIYVLAAICVFILASRVATVALLIIHAPEDAEPYFFIKQILISAICIAAIVWIWGKRVQQ